MTTTYIQLANVTPATTQTEYIKEIPVDIVLWEE